MAYTRGCFGKVKLRPAASATGEILVGELVDWSIDESAEQNDNSVMGSCASRKSVGPVEAVGEVVVNWDAADAAQSTVNTADVKYIEVYPGGSGSGSTFYKSGDTATGGCLITSRSFAGNGVDGTVGMTIGFTHPGAFTATSVP